MQTKDALTAAQNVVRHHGRGFAFIGDGCHTCRLRQRPVPFGLDTETIKTIAKVLEWIEP